MGCHYYKEDTKTTYVSSKTILPPFVNMSDQSNQSNKIFSTTLPKNTNQ